MFLLVLAALIVLNTMLQYVGVVAISLKVNQMSVSYGLCILIIVIWNTIFQLQQSICATINLLAWCGCKTNQQRVEVIEYSPILSEYRAMGLVYDNKIKATYAECLLLDVDEINHRLIGREQYACISVASLSRITEVTFCFIRQIGSELTKSLLNQCSAISQEEHVLHPVIPQQNFY